MFVLVIALSLLGLGPLQAQTKPAPPPSVAGKWTMSLEMQSGTGSPTLDLVQDGEKITGVYTGRYGKFELTGTLKGRLLQFSFTMSAEGTDFPVSFRGEVAADFQSIKGDADLGPAGEATWTAKRAPK